MSTPAENLTALRNAMQQHGLDAWIAPTADPHLSEYLPEHWQSRSYLTGFTGSAGTLTATADEAVLWTDSRYFEQAAKQLEGSGITLGRTGTDGEPAAWLAERLPENGSAGIAADMLSLDAQQHFQAAFAAKNIRLRHDADITATVWPDRPPLPAEPVFVHPAEYAGEAVVQKIDRVREAMRRHGANHHLISALDDIAWTVNLRGSDIAYNPVFLAFLLVSEQDAVLFADNSRFDDAARRQLADAGIRTAPYGDAAKAVSALSGRLLLDPAKTAVSTLTGQPENLQTVSAANPSALFKSVKNDTEAANIRRTMAEDGAALCAFFADFEHRLAAGQTLTELDVDAMLLEQRGRRPGFVSPSFGTIAGFGANGALPHYAATAESHSVISGSGLLLIDSGGQYLGGTTDITRVIPVGMPTAAQKRDFTLVLKAHIALARAVFPENLPSPMLDPVCRAHLWQAQCDYGHGTGHGVGCFLNVHEGPQRISWQAKNTPELAMKAGMLTSNEPGLYRPGRWGIRIENLVLSRPVPANGEAGAFGRYLDFETVSLCPIDTRLTDTALLDEGERSWLNRYHAEVRARLLPLTEGGARTWLMTRTEAV